MFLLLSQLMVIGSVFLITKQTDTDLEEPFLLPFGPKHGDKFIKKFHGQCSEEREFGYNLRFGSEKYESVFVCLYGYLSFDSNFYAHGFDVDGFNALSDVLIAPFWGGMDLNDNLLDNMCLYDENYQYYYGENICWLYHDDTAETIRQFLPIYSIADENVRTLVEDWSNKNFTRDEFDVTTDDDITRAVMGIETTKYANLANNVFKRQISDEKDLEKASGVIASCMGYKWGTFHATWGYVATWYKVGREYLKYGNVFNSFQTLIVCDDRQTSLVDSDDKCFVIFDFYEIQWTRGRGSHARSGLRASNGFSYELPSSGTAEMRNLWAESNCNIRGIWIFELDQTGMRDAILLPNEARMRYKLSVLCSGRMSPKYVNSYRINAQYVVNNCVLPDHTELSMKFSGANCQLTKPASFNQTGNKIEGFYPDNWGVHEDVEATLVIDGIEVEGSWNIVFFSPNVNIQKTSSKVDLSVSENRGKATLNWPSSFANGLQIGLQTITGTGSDNGCLQTKTETTTLNNGSTSYDALVNPNALFTVFSVIEQSSGTDLWTPPVVGESTLTCESWLEKDSKRDLTKCTKNLGIWFGCPRVSSPERFGNELNDVWFAHEEARGGLSGWEYDICCNQNDPTTRDELNKIGYCSNTTCEFNPGAHFCIRSPRLACLENDDVIYVSNKCCYNSENLIIEPGKGAGSLNLEVNALYNLEPHHRTDIEPYKACCVKSSGKTCDLYWSHRPPITGIYWTRVMIFGRGDPNFETIDGANYPFNGLGVYTLLETTSEGDTKIQISTRRVGDGTVFSGFVVKNDGKNFEGYINESGVFKVSIDKEVLELGLLPEYTSNGISVKESLDQKEFTFEVLDVKLIVKVVITGNYLNLMVSVPPTFHSRTKGLLGYYDGDVSNDFTTSDGKILSPDEDFQTLHEQFGESYSVQQGDWLFQDEDTKASIQNDIDKGSPFVASYVIEFESTEDYNKAAEACGNDTACIRDVALTKDFSFATNFKEIEQKVKDSAFFSELYRLNAPDPAIFKEEETNEATNPKPHLLKCLWYSTIIMSISFLG